MPGQEYKNHVRYYIPHHFIFYPIVSAMFILSLKNGLDGGAYQSDWLMMALLIFMLGWLSFMMRQHYALANQNRMVRLEMRLRYYQLTQKRFEIIESRLSLKQIAALRFAGDDELAGLIDKALTENLEPDVIKKLIKNWQPDMMRV